MTDQIKEKFLPVLTSPAKQGPFVVATDTPGHLRLLVADATRDNPGADHVAVQRLFDDLRNRAPLVEFAADSPQIVHTLGDMQQTTKKHEFNVLLVFMHSEHEDLDDDEELEHARQHLTTTLAPILLWNIPFYDLNLKDKLLILWCCTAMTKDAIASFCEGATPNPQLALTLITSHAEKQLTMLEAHTFLPPFLQSLAVDAKETGALRTDTVCRLMKEYSSKVFGKLQIHNLAMAHEPGADSETEDGEIEIEGPVSGPPPKPDH